MRRMNLVASLTLLLATLCCVTCARADDGNSCGDAADKIIANAYPAHHPRGEIDTDRMVCKAWPARPGLLLVAIPLMQHVGDDFNTGDLDLLVLDQQTLRVRQRLLLPGLMADDAVRIDELSFDTARYQLSPDVMAFGIRLHFEGSSRVDPFEESDLRLFAIHDGQLISVLDGIAMLRSNGEWDGNCAGEFSSTTRTLTMGKAVHHGYHDLLASERSTSRRAVADQQGHCSDSSSKAHSDHTLLIFDGSRYPVPKSMQPLQ